jgi:hypothetical protein
MPISSPRATVTKHRTDATPGERCKSRLNVAVSADIENDELLPDRPYGPAFDRIRCCRAVYGCRWRANNDEARRLRQVHRR